MSSPPDSISGSANAKINLGLEILRRRPDGYHDLATIFCPIGLSDLLTCTRTNEDITLDVSGLHVPADGTNLCMRAAQLLSERSRAPVGVHMTLTKRIPVGAGLGGGSSDAATALRILNTLWHTGLSDPELFDIGRSLGADVPYFMHGGLAYAEGIGDSLTYLAGGFPYWIVVVVPPEHVSTAWAYGQVQPRNSEGSGLRRAFEASREEPFRLETVLENDFEGVVLPAFPVIRETMDTLRQEGLSCVRMSGSGSAVFGLTDGEQAALAAADRFSAPFITSITPPLQT